ncbi:hypothetical protein JTE90_023204 [Oedothorax gibbosus]|uniref:Uncharacterized protein n=1 Tax=Oedothorax gibbosus TaxID=931172 RepID=A0AAV6VIR4_9ARAC|nr:hypothetical protein JTE90_023204 [Oedothorax gibbosus]
MQKDSHSGEMPIFLPSHSVDTRSALINEPYRNSVVHGMSHEGREDSNSSTLQRQEDKANARMKRHPFLIN